MKQYICKLEQGKIFFFNFDHMLYYEAVLGKTYTHEIIFNKEKQFVLKIKKNLLRYK